MRKTICMILLGILLAMTTGVGVCAAPSPVVQADSVAAGADAEIKIPVQIKNNPGIMGFRIRLSYNKDDLTVTNVESGDLTQSGIFNHSLQNGIDSFDVLWSGAEGSTQDGVLFVLYVKTTSSFNKESAITLSNIKKDTFDEQFNPVKLTCKDIVVKYDKKLAGTELEERPEEEYLSSEIAGEVTSQLKAEAVVNTIKSVLKEENVSDLSKLTPEQSKKVLDKIIVTMKEQGLDTKPVKKLLKQTDSSESADADNVRRNAVEKIYKDSRAEELEDDGIKISETVKKADRKTDDLAVRKVLIPAGVIVILLICGVALYRKTRRNRNEKA